MRNSETRFPDRDSGNFRPTDTPMTTPVVMPSMGGSLVPWTYSLDRQGTPESNSLTLKEMRQGTSSFKVTGVSSSLMVVCPWETHHHQVIATWPDTSVNWFPEVVRGRSGNYSVWTHGVDDSRCRLRRFCQLPGTDPLTDAWQRPGRPRGAGWRDP